MVSLFAAPDVATGFVIGECRGYPRAKVFANLPEEINALSPERPDVRVVADDHVARRTAAIGAWLARRLRWRRRRMEPHDVVDLVRERRCPEGPQ